MGFHLIVPMPENVVDRRIPVVQPSARVGTPKPSRGPKFTSVLSTKYTDDETGLVLNQPRDCRAGVRKPYSRPNKSHGNDQLGQEFH